MVPAFFGQIGFLVGIYASQLPFQRVVLLLADQALLLRRLCCGLQAIGQHFVFACEDGVVCALAGDAIVYRCRPYSLYPFDFDIIEQLSSRASWRCHECAGWVCGGKAKHGDDGFAVEQGIGPDGHDRPGVCVARFGNPLLKPVEPVSDLSDASASGILDKFVVANSCLSRLRGGNQPMIV